MSLADDPVAFAAELKSFAQHALALAAAIESNGWRPEELDEGLNTGRFTDEGKELYVGDRVQVLGSDRYGDPVAIVKGPGPDLGDGKPRVHVALENGQDDVYTPSASRVHLIGSEPD